MPSYTLFSGELAAGEEKRATLDKHVIDAVLILEGGEDDVNTTTWTSPTQTHASSSCSSGGNSVNCTGRQTTAGGQTYPFQKCRAPYPPSIRDVEGLRAPQAVALEAIW